MPRRSSVRAENCWRNGRASGDNVEGGQVSRCNAADALIDSIDNKCRILAEYPLMGRRRTELGSDLHSFAEGRYVIFYRVQSGRIEIVRVLHGARDIPRLFES